MSLCFRTHPTDVANLIDPRLTITFYSSFSSSTRRTRMWIKQVRKHNLRSFISLHMVLAFVFFRFSSGSSRNKTFVKETGKQYFFVLFLTFMLVLCISSLLCLLSLLLYSFSYLRFQEIRSLSNEENTAPLFCRGLQR